MNPAIGQILRQTRQERNLSLEDVSRATLMRANYLQALETGDLQSIPSATQARGFFKAYADYLGLDPEQLIRENQIYPEKPAAAQEAHEQPVGDPAQADGKAAEEIFLEVGDTLRNQRELLGLTIEDVERHTHLKRHYLIAMEAGDLDGLPSPVQGRGMFKNYATFLGLDADRLLLQFADGLQARYQTAQQQTKTPSKKKKEKSARVPFGVRRLFSADILIGFSAAVFMMAFVLWGAIRIFAMRSNQVPTATAPSIADVLLASATPSPSATFEPPTPTGLPQAVIAPTQQPLVTVIGENGEIQAVPGSLQVNVVVHQRAFFQVLVDGEVVFSGRVIPGSAYAYSGSELIELLTGNGAAIQVYYNQADTGRLGEIGEVVHRIYSPAGVVTATPTVSATPTATVPATSTPAATGILPTATQTAILQP
jgi:cytoskeletal protein RodZ